MVGEVDLDRLLAAMKPVLQDGEFVFSSITSKPFSELDELRPLACYHEAEGLSLLLEKSVAQQHDLEHTAVFRCITLSVHSSLDAVGLTAAVASKLAANDIPANVIAAFYHDHVFVPKESAEQALCLLQEFESSD